jgi:hypothetical protein
MRRTAMAIAMLATAAMALPAQTSAWKPELRPFLGASVPTGGQRDLFKDAAMFGVQGALELRPTFHVLGTFSWVPAQNKYAAGDDNVSIFAYDAGIEKGLVQPLRSGWELRPFFGVGAGARTYSYASPALRDQTCVGGYGALGSELQLRRVALRLEARDNVFCYKSPVGGVESKTRSDFGFALGFAYHFR